MANRWGIPEDVLSRLRRDFKTCAYCRRKMKAYRGVIGCPGDKATIEHLNRKGPIYWSNGLQEEHLVMTCSRCNASRGQQRIADWFESPYCLERGINANTVAARVKKYLRTRLAKR